jgi:hypothetical protein
MAAVWKRQASGGLGSCFVWTGEERARTRCLRSFVPDSVRSVHARKEGVSSIGCALTTSHTFTPVLANAPPIV